MLAKIRAAIAAGVDWVQIREKDLSAREMLELTGAACRVSNEEARERAARQTGSHARATPARILVNDRLDVALAAGAAGVHLGGESVPASEIVRWLPSGNAAADFLVGVSCHSLKEVLAAENTGASYAFFGPVFDSPAKRVFGAPHGVARLEEVCRSVKIPVIAIGGVNPENAEECLSAGASGIAAIRLFQQEGLLAGKLEAAVARLQQAR